MLNNSKILIAGRYGMVGAAIERSLRRQGYYNIIGEKHKELDLENQVQVIEYFKKNEPEYVFMAAAKVGGIHANSTYPAEFIRNNLRIQDNVIHYSYMFGVRKLLFLGSCCIYPGNAPVPVKEEYLLSGYLEPSNDAYAIAKIAGIKMCQAYNKQYGTKYIACMPTNLYGIGDNYHPVNSHVIPGLLRRMYESKLDRKDEFGVWGTGNPRREFLYSEDLADACVLLMNKYDSGDLINIGYGSDITIMELVEFVQKEVGYNGKIVFDTSKPDGTAKRLLDSTKMFNLGWKPKMNLEDGLKVAYNDFMLKINRD